jgi:hypothetical protein
VGDAGKRFLTMRHFSGRSRPVEFIDIVGVYAQCWLTGDGAQHFRLSDGGCEDYDRWFIDGEDLQFVRELARSRKIKFPVKQLRRTKKERKKKPHEDDPRQGKLLFDD